MAKYIDNGASATVAWTQVAGGAGTDLGTGIALSGNSIYLTGTLENNTTNTNAVVFGGAGTTPGTLLQYGATPVKSADIVLAKYTDNGPSATVAWVQVGGGTGYDQGVTIALNGSSVYLVGQFTNSLSNANAAVFGGSGTTLGTVPQAGASPSSSSDIVLTKYTDNGPTATVNWKQAGGGTGDDQGYSVAVSNSSLYITGFYTNNAAKANAVLFGGTGTTAGTVSVPGVSTTTAADIVVAKYVDNGSSAALTWTQTAGGAGYDYGNELVISGSRLYVVGQVVPAATFGSLTISAPAGTTTNFVAALDLPAPLATSFAAASAPLSLYPNPATGPAALSGASPNTAVHIFDALGRRVATATADATGAAALPSGLAPGLYMVRAGAATVREAVE